MGKSIRVTTKKKRGRPPTTGKGVQVGERWHADELATIDAWIAASGKNMTRAQAIRRLVEIGLAAHAPIKQTSSRQKLRAQEMAGGALDKLADREASSSDQVGRKRQLLEGPAEFRAQRGDKSKKD